MNSKKRCKQCKKYEYNEKILNTLLGNFCSNQCRIDWGLANIEKLKKKVFSDKNKVLKIERSERKEKLKSLESISQYECRVQKIFNEYIRLRDKKEPCISCSRHHQGQYHAGHYLSVGAHRELRFQELNVHKQCSVCNNYDSGNLIGYRINLIKKIGLKKVEWLEGPHTKIKRNREEIQAIESLYKMKLKEIKKVN
jgi:hypothetical protein